MSALTQALVDVGFNVRRAEAIEAAILGAAPNAEDVAFTPAGNIAATNVQDAIEELDTEKVPTARTLTAGNGLTGGGDLSADRSFAVGAGTGISVAADAVALADMAEATIKGRAAGAGTGAPQDLTAAQVRAIVNPGLVFLNSNTVSNQATLEIVLTAYTAYRGLLILLDLVPATDNVSLLMRVSTNGGSSYDSGASDYRWSGTSWSSASVAAVGSTGDSSIGLAGAIGNGSDEGVDVEVIIIKQTSTTKKTKIMSRVWTYQAADTAVGRISSAHRNAAQDTDAVQFFMSSGNLTGSWAIYGYA